MCRLAAITSDEYFSPMENVHALNTMKEGHDGSGMGLVLKDLGGAFSEFKDLPILSCISSRTGFHTVNEYMHKHGFVEKYMWSPTLRPVSGIERHDHYFSKVYQYPDYYRDRPLQEKEELLLKTRLDLREMGQADESIVVFSFYPDVLSLKEVVPAG